MAGRNRPPAPKTINKITVGPSSKGSARFPLSGSPTGKGILLTNSDQAIHKFSTGVLEEVYLWCANYSASDVILHLNFNGAGSTAVASTVQTSIPSREGLVLVWPGIPHASPLGEENTSTTNHIIAKAASNSALLLYGFIVRHYPRDRDNIGGSGYNYGPTVE
tara:strand:+ start:1213 stop:1701 length:489 start_codon:yes stop_codon:yes gene_type:complete